MTSPDIPHVLLARGEPERLEADHGAHVGIPSRAVFELSWFCFLRRDAPVNLLHTTGEYLAILGKYKAVGVFSYSRQNQCRWTHLATIGECKRLLEVADTLGSGFTAYTYILPQVLHHTSCALVHTCSHRSHIHDHNQGIYTFLVHGINFRCPLSIGKFLFNPQAVSMVSRDLWTLKSAARHLHACV